MAYLTFPHQKLFDEIIDVAIQNFLRLAGFKISAVVFDHLVGMQHVGADLRAPNTSMGYPSQDSLG